jgi:predicted ATPase
LIAAVRLVTLTGAGGVGKTRLTLELAAVLAQRFRDGAWLVELAPLRDPTHIAQAIAGAIGLKEQPGRPVDEALLATLRAREILLVLDNCEHLIGGCADFAQRLLCYSPVPGCVSSRPVARHSA